MPAESVAAQNTPTLTRMGGLVHTGAYQLFYLIRYTIGYLSFAASLITGLTLLLDREFADAALIFLAKAIGPVERVYEFAQTIMAFWDAHVIQPIHGLIAVWLNIDPPLWTVEIGTLFLFATGPVLRAIWTARSIRKQTSRRLAQYKELRTVLAAQESELAKLQKAVDNKDWDKVKSAAGMASSLALGALGAAFGQTGGHSARYIQLSWQSLKSSFSGWKQVQAEIDRLRSVVGQLKDRAQTFGAADDGLLARLAGADPELANKEIAAFVKSRMRVARALSRIALGLAAAVVLAYVVDWTLTPN